MYKYLFIIVISFLSMACSKNARQVNELRINPELSPYLDLFKSEGQKRGVNLVIDDLILDFGPITEGTSQTLGLCNTKFKTDESDPLDFKYQTTPNVVISRDWWNYFTDSNLEMNKRELVVHELGHCILKLKHNNKLNKSTNIPESFMYPNIISGQNDDFRAFVTKYESVYFDQLFGLIELAASKVLSTPSQKIGVNFFYNQYQQVNFQPESDIYGN